MTQSIPLGFDARERFLLEIAAVIPPHRVTEVHFFAPLRQGPLEMGVAVIAATPEGADIPVSVLAAAEAAEAEAGAELEAQSSAKSDVTADVEVDSALPEFPEGARLSSRHVVYSARYRWTRKGPERGKWESEVLAEADAPLLTVETVVQGVMKRASEPLEVEKLDGETVRAMIAKAQLRWPTTP